MVSSSHLLQGASPLSPRAVWLTLPGASKRAPQLRRRGKGAPQAARALQSRMPLFIPPLCGGSPIPHRTLDTKVQTLPGGMGKHCPGPAPGQPAPGGAAPGDPHLGGLHVRTYTWGPAPGGLHLGACSWGPAPRGPLLAPAPGALHLEGLYRGLGTGARARAIFPSSHLMPARYLSSPSISLSSTNRKGRG